MREALKMERSDKTARKNKNETSQKILAATFKCISTRGCANVGLREIAAESGVALSQVTYHYGTRERLFAAVIQKMVHEYISEVETQMAAFDTLTGKVRCLIQYNQERLLSDKMRYRIFADFSNLAMWSKSFKKELRQFKTEVSKVIENQLQLDKEAMKAAPQISPATLTTVIMGTSLGLSMEYLMGADAREVINGFDLLAQTLEQTIKKQKISKISSPQI